jgi:hypothetical protein
MSVGFIPLVDLIQMHEKLGNRFLHQNIRYSLGEAGAVNKAILNALKNIAVEMTDAPSTFAFNHNGVTLYVTSIRPVDGVVGATHELLDPRLLNGAQSVTTAARFLQTRTGATPLSEEGLAAFSAIRLLCRIVTSSEQAFVTRVTINNNRQNPVEPWNLRANDLIQLLLQDKFREDLGIYYERQKNAFENLLQQEMEDLQIREQAKAVELLKLAQTFTVTDGNISRLSDLRRVFEEEAQYQQTFRDTRLRADTRHILLCYKAASATRAAIAAIQDKAAQKYQFIDKARNLIWALLCQAILNDERLDDLVENFGEKMAVQAGFREMTVAYAISKVRPVLAGLIDAPEYRSQIDQGKFSFLRSDSTFRRAMNIAKARWNWSHKRLG